MLAPRPWGLSLLKIRRHKHLLDDLILVIVLGVPHDLDDFIGRVLCLADASLGLGRVFFLVIVLYLHLRGAGACIGTRAGRTLGAIVTEMSLLAAGETLACCYDNARISHFLSLLFITCTIIVGHMTDTSSLHT
jgi:hypothetical protein